MLPINIYALTRIEKTASLQYLERKLSCRSEYLKIRNWEVQSLKLFSERLFSICPETASMTYYYSFQIPKLGKEFDLLRISEDLVINIELKSRPVSDEDIKKQLILNRYYLSTICKTVHSYTYISDTGRLVRLTNGSRILDTSWETLVSDLLAQTNCSCGPIEPYFEESRYLISPLSEPDRFLLREYILTTHQRDIRKRILNQIRIHHTLFQGFTGLPGTGKTLLLYDLALTLSCRHQVCVLHFRTGSEVLYQLNHQLKRITLQYCSDEAMPDLKKYRAILVDEAENITLPLLNQIIHTAENYQIPVIFSYDCETCLSPDERSHTPVDTITALSGYIHYQLTNRMRMNAELSEFIQNLMHPVRYRKYGAPSMTPVYANDSHEAQVLLDSFLKEGYIYIYDSALSHPLSAPEAQKTSIMDAKGYEFDQIIMILDTSFFYDENHYLRSVLTTDGSCSPVRNLFCGLNRAKRKIALLVIQNTLLFDQILEISRGRISK